MDYQKRKKIDQSGLSLIETVIGIAILAVVGLSLFSLFDLTLRVIWENKARAGAQALVNLHMETVRNMPYNQVGTVGGIPVGYLTPTATATLNGIGYTVHTAVIYIDDEFDGTQGSIPDDSLPTDYKRVRIEVAWDFRLQSSPVVFVTDVAPRGLESELGGGTLRLSALDSQGLPVPQASVQVVNSSVNPPIDLAIMTNESGQALLPGATTSIEAYAVTVSKAGYSTDQTYAADPVDLPTPSQPHLSVLEGQVTDVAFSIDLLSQMNISSILAEDNCSLVALENFSQYAVVDLLPGSPGGHRRRLNFNRAEAEPDFRMALQESIYVNGVSGSDATGDGTSGNPYATLGRGLSDVDQSEGDVINLAGGQTYTEGPFVLNSSFSGTTSTPTVIQAWPGTATPTIATLGSRVFEFNGARNFILDHLALTGATSTEGVFIDDGSVNITVQNSHLSDAANTGIWLKGGSNHTVIGNTIEANGSYGILVDSSVNIIQGNQISGHSSAGIRVNAGTNDLIQNTLLTNGHGLEVLAGNTLINNNVAGQNTGHGIYVLQTSGQNTISNNVSYGNLRSGFMFENAGGKSVSDNQAYQNTDHGFWLAGGVSVLSGNVSHDNLKNGYYVEAAGQTFNSDEAYQNDLHGFDVAAENISLQGITSRQNDLNGLRLAGCNDCLLNGSLISENLNHGLEITASLNMQITSNELYGNVGRGIFLNNASSHTLAQNLIYRQGSSAIELIGSLNNLLLSNTLAQNGVDGVSLTGSSTGNVIRNNIIAFNSSWGLEDEDNASEPADTYNFFFNNVLGDMKNLTPASGGAGTATGTDPLFVDLSGDNYHLQSSKGYFPFGPADVSGQSSPAIDGGDPADVYAAETVPNGCRLNLGVYGGSPEASKSSEAGDPLPNLDLTLRGAKIIGQNSAGQDVYKFTLETSTDASGYVNISNLEWDAYTLLVNATSTGYDIAYVNPPQSISLLPDTTLNVEIGLVADSAHSFHLLVLDSADQLPEAGVNVRLYNTDFGFDESHLTADHGQAFFSQLQPGTYTLEVSKTGFQPVTASANVSWYTSEAVTLTP